MGIQSALHKHDKNSNQRHDQHARPAEPYKCATYNNHCNNYNYSFNDRQ